MEIFTYILTAILAVALIAAGIFLCCRSQPPRTTTVTAVLSIGFLMLLLLHMSKFKHVQGFGFDAETWDEKQVEAAQLVDQLSSASEALSQQVALVASRLGLWGSGLTNPELADLLQQTRKTLEAAKIPKARRDEILSPIKQRIAYNYWETAYRNLDAIYAHQYVTNLENQNDLKREQDTLFNLNRDEQTKIDLTISEIPRNIEPLIEVVNASKVFKPPSDLQQELIHINDDLKFFVANDGNTLRRKIDLASARP
jgi:hypothetical protein